MADALCKLNGQLKMAPAQLMLIIITAEYTQGLNRERTVKVEVREMTVEQPGLFSLERSCLKMDYLGTVVTHTQTI